LAELPSVLSGRLRRGLAELPSVLSGRLRRAATNFARLQPEKEANLTSAGGPAPRRRRPQPSHCVHCVGGSDCVKPLKTKNRDDADDEFVMRMILRPKVPLALERTLDAGLRGGGCNDLQLDQHLPPAPQNRHSSQPRLPRRSHSMKH
jgi:hypothetical protein